MFKPVDQALRNIGYVLDSSVCKVGFQYRDDFVVSLLTIDHSQTANRTSTEKKASVRKCFFRQHTDVHRIAISVDLFQPRPLSTKRPHFHAAKGLGNESVKRRTHRRKALGAINLQMSGCLIKFVLNSVSRNDFDIGVDQLWCLNARCHAVPWMCLKEMFWRII